MHGAVHVAVLRVKDEPPPALPPKTGVYDKHSHVFLSHDPLAEEQLAFLKIKLSTLVPTCTIFLHKEGMRDAS